MYDVRVQGAAARDELQGIANELTPSHTVDKRTRHGMESYIGLHGQGKANGGVKTLTGRPHGP